MAERIDPIGAIRKFTNANTAGEGGSAQVKKQQKKKNEPTKKVLFDKPGNFLYPVPCVMVSCASEGKRPNIITVAWAGTICSEPPMLSISVRRERYSYEMIKESGEFAVNLTNRRLARAADYCGCRSGKDVDKFEECHLTAVPCSHIHAPMIGEAPVSIECKVTGIIPLGSHDMFLAEIVGVNVDQKYLDHRGTFHMENAGLIAYSHGKYYELGKVLGGFGYSVRKKR
jgi:flavin reductase (DIM6/NTAB) family NADH-FMN oxidoreductase RutF